MKFLVQPSLRTVIESVEIKINEQPIEQVITFSYMAIFLNELSIANGKLPIMNLADYAIVFQ